MSAASAQQAAAAAAAATISAQSVQSLMLKIDSYVWLVPLACIPTVWLLRSMYYKWNKECKRTELALYTIYIPFELAACALLLYYSLVHTMQLAYSNITTMQELFPFVLAYIDNHVHIAYMLAVVFLVMFIIEIAARFDTMNWQLTVHHMATMLLVMLANIAIRYDTEDVFASLIIWDCATITIQYAAWDWIPHIALLCRRLNDGYHSVKLTPATHGWRYWCKQVEHWFYVGSFTAMPLIRTAILLLQILYYTRVLGPNFSQFILNKPYLMQHWVIIHMTLIGVLYMTQWVGTWVIYKHLWLKSLKEQYRATAVTKEEAVAQDREKYLTKHPEFRCEGQVIEVNGLQYEVKRLLTVLDSTPVIVTTDAAMEKELPSVNLHYYDKSYDVEKAAVDLRLAKWKHQHHVGINRSTADTGADSDSESTGSHRDSEDRLLQQSRAAATASPVSASINLDSVELQSIVYQARQQRNAGVYNAVANTSTYNTPLDSTTPYYTMTRQPSMVSIQEDQLNRAVGLDSGLESWPRDQSFNSVYSKTSRSDNSA